MESIHLLQIEPYNPSLKNHPLHGEQIGLRAISAGGDLRLVFYEINEYKKVVFLRVGTHEQVY